MQPHPQTRFALSLAGILIVFAILAALIGMLVTCAGSALAQPRLPTPTPSAPQATPTQTPIIVPTATPTPTPGGTHGAGFCRRPTDPSICYSVPNMTMQDCIPGDTWSNVPCGTPGPTPTPTAPVGTPTATPTPVPTIAWTTGKLFPGQVPPYTYFQQFKVYRDVNGWEGIDNNGWMAGPCEQILAFKWAATATYRVIFPPVPSGCNGAWEDGGATLGFITEQRSVFMTQTYWPAVAALTQVFHESTMGRLMIQDSLADQFLNTPVRDLNYTPLWIAVPARVVVTNRPWLYLNKQGGFGALGYQAHIVRYWLPGNSVQPWIDVDFGENDSPDQTTEWGYGLMDFGIAPDGKMLGIGFGKMGDTVGRYWRSTDEGKTWAAAGTVPCPTGLVCWDWHFATDYKGAILWQGDPGRPALVTMDCAPAPGSGDWSNGSWGACYAVAPGYALPASWGQQPVAMFPAQAVTVQQAAAQAVKVGPPARPFSGPLLRPRTP